MGLLDRIKDAFSTEEPELGEGTGRQGPWKRDPELEGTADARSLEVEGDPRGGFQSPEYRHADPREVVVTDGVAMSGPGGAPTEDDRFDVEPGDRTRWTDDPAEEQELDPESEPGRGAPYERQADAESDSRERSDG